jgi:hypothetical protein
MTAPDPMRHVTRSLWTLLVFGTGASVTANIAHAVMTAHPGDWFGPVLIALLAPTALLGLMHLMGLWARDTGRGGRGAVYWTFLAAVIALGAVAFRLSFVAVRDLAIHYHYSPFDASLVPLMLDGLMVICTVGLVAATRRTTTAEPVPMREPAPATTRAPEPEQPPQTASGPLPDPHELPAMRPAKYAAMTGQSAAFGTAPVREPASPPQPEPAAERATAVRGSEAAIRPLARDGSPDLVTEDRHLTAVHRLAAVPAPRVDRELPVEQTAAQAAPIRELDEEQVAVQTTPVRAETDAQTATQTAVETAMVRDAQADTVRGARPTAEQIELAERVIAAGRTTAPVEVVAAVIAAKQTGLANAKAASAAGCSVSAVQRIWTAVRELEAVSA